MSSTSCPLVGASGGVVTRSLASAVLIASLPAFLFGYCTGVLNAVESVVFPDHTTAQWAAAVSSFCLGGVVGARWAGPVADAEGRKRGLLGVAWVYVVSGAMQFLSVDMAMLICARALAGVAGGASTVLTPMYLGEVSPMAVRGSIGMMTQVATVFGILASILLALPFATEEQWRRVFLPIPVVGLLQIFPGALLMPESPRWLRLRGRDEDARTSLNSLGGIQNVASRDEEDGFSENMLHGSQGSEGFAEERKFTRGADSTLARGSMENSSKELRESKGMTLRQFLVQKRNRIPVISSILFPVAQQLSGINAVFYYSTTFFEGASVGDPKMATLAAFGVNTLATLLALPLADRVGRRTLLSLSAGGMFACCILVTLAMLQILPNAMSVVSILLYIVFFELGLGCIPFFLVSELIEPRFFGRMQSAAMTVNWLCNFLVGMCFPFMVRQLGSYSFVPFAVSLLTAFVYAVVWLPETRGKSIEEVLADVERR